MKMDTEIYTNLLIFQERDEFEKKPGKAVLERSPVYLGIMVVVRRRMKESS